MHIPDQSPIQSPALLARVAISFHLVTKAIQVLLKDGPIELWKKGMHYYQRRKDSPSAPASDPSEPVIATYAEDRAKINHDPIFVYQMGRVGSKSIERSLSDAYRKLAIDIPILHAHYLNNYEQIEMRARKDLPDPIPFIRDLEIAKEHRRRLIGAPNASHLKLISVVRDIIARNVSTFFYALSEFIPDWEKRLANNSLTVDYLQEVFLSKRAYQETAENWFDEQMKPVFDIDIYAVPFPTKVGYKLYSSPKADLLLFRLEDLEQRAPHAIKEFLGLENFELATINTGDERATGELYRLFKNKPLPLEYVKRMYNIKLARHFYTADELAEFTHRWAQV